MTIKKLIADAAETHHRVELRRRDDRIASLSSEVKELTERLDRAARRTALRNCLAGAPELRPRQRTAGGKREAVAVVMVSDLHLEETILSGAVNGLNSFDLAAADRRMLRLADAIAWEISLERHAFEINQMVLWLGGDIITGEIHEDLLASNGLGLSKAVRFARQQLIRLIRSVLALDVDLTVVCNDGNHGRLDKRQRVATRVDNSMEAVLYDSIAEAFEPEKKARFVLPEGILTYQKILSTMVRFTHGDAVKYLGGVGGILIPINKAVAQWDKSIHADHTIMGHWHQRLTTRRVSVNGSLPGYGAYSLWIKAEPEPPQQGLLLIDSKRGVCHPKDLWVAERGK